MVDAELKTSQAARDGKLESNTYMVQCRIATPLNSYRFGS